METQYLFMANVKGLGEVHSFPVYASPSGLVSSCIGWAAQDVVSNEVDDPVLTEWYIFNERQIENDVEYYGLVQSDTKSEIKKFRKSELMKIPHVVIEEDVRVLHQLKPPERWIKVG